VEETIVDAPIDQGPDPFIINIEEATEANENYRTALWTGTNLQLTVMSIEPGGDIGLEVHSDHDQFLRVESGRARVQMGATADNLNFEHEIEEDWVILVPAGAWHNLTNLGHEPLKVYSLYAPPEHEHGTVHPTKQDDPDHQH
jgi:mannose-6-phosphate isomerase-like protein (cupin superfamily)